MNRLSKIQTTLAHIQALLNIAKLELHVQHWKCNVRMYSTGSAMYVHTALEEQCTYVQHWKCNVRMYSTGSAMYVRTAQEVQCTYVQHWKCNVRMCSTGSAMYAQKCSEIFDCGQCGIKAASLQRTQFEVPKYFVSIVPIHLNLQKRTTSLPRT